MSRRAKLRFVTLLTLARYPLVLVFFAGALVHTSTPRPWLFVLSLCALAASAATDLVDGYLARRFDVQTRFGAHVDPLMDKFFYLSTLPVLVFLASQNGHERHALFLLVLTMTLLARDQWVTFLRSIGSLFNVGGEAHWSGKFRTAVNFPLIGFIYYLEESPWPLIPATFVYGLEALAMVVNLLSVYTYSRRYWPSLVKSADFRD